MLYSRSLLVIHYIFFLFLLFLKINKLINLWLCCVFVSVRGLSPVAASGGHSSLRCVGLSLSRPLLLRSTGSRRAGSVTVAHRPNCSMACGIFRDQGLNLCPLHWQADSQPLRHQGSPVIHFKYSSVYVSIPNFLTIPSPHLFPGNHKFSTAVFFEKKSTYKWTLTVQTHVVQGLTVVSFSKKKYYVILNLQVRC